MSHIRKLLSELRNRDTGSVRFDDLITLSRRYGIDVDNNGGSIHVFRHDAATQGVTIHKPHGGRDRLWPSDLKRFEGLLD